MSGMGPPEMSPNWLNDMRRELLAWFSRNAPSLGELYYGALKILYEHDNFPGRVRFVCHAVRDIRNRLPDVIAGPKAGGPLQYKNRLDDIVKIWKQHGLPLDGSLPPIKVTEAESMPSISNNGVPVPRPVYMKVANLMRDHVRTRETSKEAAERLFQAIDPKNRTLEATLKPRIDNWIRSTEWFVERAHDRGQTDAEMGREELRKRFEVFEYTLSAMLREFFKTVGELDEILEEANS